MRRVRGTLAPLLLLPGVYAMAACASPGEVVAYRADVLRNNERALAENDAAYQKAVEWNVRVLGLPASGAIVVYIVAIVAVVAVVAIIAVYRYRKNEYLAKYLNKAPCSVCGSSFKKRTES